MARLLQLVAACMLMIGVANAQTLAWCGGQQGISTLTESTIPASLGVEAAIPLCVLRSADNTVRTYGVEVRKVFDEVADSFPTFATPYDEINFPPEADTRWEDGTGDSPTSNWEREQDGGEANPLAAADEFNQKFYFKPSVGSECVYTVCFEGFYAGDNSTTAEKSCHKIEVKNTVAYFDGADMATESVSTSLTPQNGFFAAAWVYPACDASADGNMTILSFESDRGEGEGPDEFGRTDSGLKVRNSINYQPSTGTFFYYDCYMGEAMSKPEYCCDKWHYVGLSITEEGKGQLFVDGIGPKLMSERERDIIKYSVVDFETQSRPDTTGNSGKLRIGRNFRGYMDDLGIWDESKTPGDFNTFHHTRDFSNTGYAEFWDMTVNPLAGLQSENFKKTATPAVTPCVLGMEHSVGPVDGACVTEIYGWNFADGINPKCSFGGVETKAAMVSSNPMDGSSARTIDTIKCETPGHVSPRFVDVTASNNGFNFTDLAKTGKTVKHLFLESSLYLTGEGNGGAEADSVCNDLPTKAVSFGAWVCPKCGPPVPPPPPSPPSPVAPAPPPSPSPPPPSPPPPQILGEGNDA
eukprot:CAMPEP_0118927384 /NCGR_PEP_ID=MMETSP1169-20130426/4855_1 /TAXON_ID=36882 /ORGANISM="Pyramimonas obovata, Strain CCMP722" /LENGTH=580 /DNA_ID=CAMNT_0006869131 /DNA_START=133 /DNA_END=1875 /DNA_ORIENTATION=+